MHLEPHTRLERVPNVKNVRLMSCITSLFIQIILSTVYHNPREHLPDTNFEMLKLLHLGGLRLSKPSFRQSYYMRLYWQQYQAYRSYISIVDTASETRSNGNDNDSYTSYAWCLNGSEVSRSLFLSRVSYSHLKKSLWLCRRTGQCRKKLDACL